MQCEKDDDGFLRNPTAGVHLASFYFYVSGERKVHGTHDGKELLHPLTTAPPEPSRVRC